MFTQSVRWMVIPLPLVTKPTISSPGTGEQHFENRTDRSAMPLTTIPLLFLALMVNGFAAASAMVASTSSLVISFL